MNALASDQANRVAKEIVKTAALSGYGPVCMLAMRRLLSRKR